MARPIRRLIQAAATTGHLIFDMSRQGYAGINQPVCQFSEQVFTLPSVPITGLWSGSAWVPSFQMMANFHFELAAGAGFKNHQIFMACDMTNDFGFMAWYLNGAGANDWVGDLYPWIKAKMTFVRNSAAVGSTQLTIESPTQGWSQPTAGVSVASEFLGNEFAQSGTSNGKGGGMSLVLSGGKSYSIPAVEKRGLIDKIVIDGQIGYVVPSFPNGSLNYWQETQTAYKGLYVGIISK